MQLLMRLELTNCKLLPLQQPGGGGVDGAFTCLAAVRSLHHLKHLSVRANMHGDRTDQTAASLSTAQVCDCAALTASPHLTHLEFYTKKHAQLLPTAALQHMIPAGRQLPQLQQLVLHWERDWLYQDEGSISTADLRSMISACPGHIHGLCHLDLRGFVAEGADVSPLPQLPATCHSLEAAGFPFDGNAAGVIGQLTCLVWNPSPGLTEAGLLSLTALQGLQSFVMRANRNLSGAVVPKDEGEMFVDFELKTRHKVLHQNMPASTVGQLNTGQQSCSSAQHNKYGTVQLAQGLSAHPKIAG